ncbi:MAG: nucleotidyl transferase AbiEii/AbiGii toxin family protein [Planctomycetaceae bacterium]
MFNLVEFRDCLERAVSLLRTCEIRFLITGGAAAIAYGDPRTTQDIDLVIEGIAIQERLELFLAQLRQEKFLYNEQTVRTAVASRRQFQLLDTGSSLKLDLYPRELVPGALDRAVQVEIMPGLTLPVASRPDLVLSKLIWISKGSHKSRRDLRQIMLRVNTAETATIHFLAEQAGLRVLLDETLSEIDEVTT